MRPEFERINVVDQYGLVVLIVHVHRVRGGATGSIGLEDDIVEIEYRLVIFDCMLIV